MDVRDALAAAPVLVDENPLDDEDEAPRSAPIAGPDPHRFLNSQLLVDSLEQMADGAVTLETVVKCASAWSNATHSEHVLGKINSNNQNGADIPFRVS